MTIDEQGMLLVWLSSFMNANIFPLLSALWLVDDRAAVSLRYVLTRDRMTIFCYSVGSSVVLPAVFLIISWLIRVHSWTSAHLKPWTAQDVITPCSSHSCLTDPNLLYCGKPSEVVPSFPFPHLPIPHTHTTLPSLLLLPPPSPPPPSPLPSPFRLARRVRQINPRSLALPLHSPPPPPPPSPSPSPSSSSPSLPPPPPSSPPHPTPPHSPPTHPPTQHRRTVERRVRKNNNHNHNHNHHHHHLSTNTQGTPVFARACSLVCSGG